MQPAAVSLRSPMMHGQPVRGGIYTTCNVLVVYEYIIVRKTVQREIAVDRHGLEDLVLTHPKCDQPSIRLSAPLPQDSTDENDQLQAAAMVDGDMSVVMVGCSNGVFSGTSDDVDSMVVIKLDVADGTEIWRWQVSCKRTGIQVLDDR